MPAVDRATEERPRLVPGMPVLERGPGQLQIGLGPDAGLVLSGAPTGLRAVLALVDGNHGRSQILAAARRSDIEPELIDRILRSLSSAGLLIDNTSAPAAAIDLSRQRIRLVGAGRLGRAVATALLEAQVGSLFLVDGDPIDPAVYPRPGLASSAAQALQSVLQHLPDRDHTDGLPCATEVRVVGHWTKPEHLSPDLTVIATDRAEPDRAIGEDYTRIDHPHLFVRPLLDGVLVGPFVRPGRGPCLRCTDLTRRDADEAWPLLLAQLCRTRLPVLPLLATWAGTTAVGQLAHHLAGGVPSTASGTLELVAPECELRYRSWPMHPSCGCAWYA
ncbi:hypothetical protein FOE78_11585 [Microlunatus elymi]|uniref:Bacteriocin biosynthesis cyclodehydratase domain-containing protein n=1 Tax=Microlunatus elymi TaxID=2596828 RepID=A0A516PZR0_9ACTN|nr:ThiF family adenylyltransferase [Microlunatus elymi]QDP96461.1 hypothetical protein FOE78_11585 [Microlunatus elymi]